MRAFLVGLGFVATAACAQPGDPLRSPECAVARAALEQALEAASTKQPGSAEALAKTRRNAIDICLGRDSPGAQRTGAPDPVIAVPAPVIAVPHAIAYPEPPAPSRPLQVTRPATITACDPSGCWDSEGRRLNNVGPLVIGPRGACVVQAGTVHCP